MLDDFVLINHTFNDVPFINIYPLGDVHLGSKECNIELFKQWIEMVQSDPFGYVVVIGDVMNMGLKNSKSNVYEEVLTPVQQKEALYEFPVVEVKGREIERETTTRDEEIFNTLDVTINIYSIEKTINRKKVSSLQISNELIKLIDMAMKEMKFTMETNEEIENVDKNVYRRLLRYTAGIDVRTGKLVRRK